MISAISIKNYKRFESFKLDCKDGLNLLVGNNDTGKTTIVEAISLALTKRLNGRPLEYELSQHLFNASAVTRYLAAIEKGEKVEAPRIVIELTFAPSDLVSAMKGSNNDARADSHGVRLVVALDDDADVRADYIRLLESGVRLTALPIEYYKVSWYTFADQPLSGRNMPVKSALIDATTIRVQNGTNYYLGNAIQESLSDSERLSIAWEYRRLKHSFADQDGIKALNESLQKRDVSLSNAKLTVSLDLSQRAPWETNLTPHLNDVPVQFVGKGEQHFLKIMFALDREASACHVVLVEEPENHLAFGYLNVLLRRIDEKCAGRQVFITTHSAFVLNKLGLDRTILLGGGGPSFLTELPSTTQSYFRRLPGHDTLRLLLAKRTVLVEGPSDELFFQKAYHQAHGRLPIEDGVDVLSVRGTSAPRFLDLAKAIGHNADVIADNDRDCKRSAKRYDAYVGSRIRLCIDANEALPTLEYQVAAVNELQLLNKIFGRSDESIDDALEYMLNNKTEWALAVFETKEQVAVPKYMKPALAK